MSKDETRLVPVMEQGGNTLIGSLIEDLHREHGTHLPALQELEELQSQLCRTHATSAAEQIVEQRVRCVDDFTRELAEHIHLEDGVSFPLFCDSAAAVRGRPPSSTHRGS